MMTVPLPGGSPAITAAATGLVGAPARRYVFPGSDEKAAPPPGALEPGVLRNAWGVDSLFAFMFGSGGRLVAAGSAAFDKQVVDGSVNGLGNLVRVGGGYLRRVQTGYVRNYALVFFVGAIALMSIVTIRLVGG